MSGALQAGVRVSALTAPRQGAAPGSGPRRPPRHPPDQVDDPLPGRGAHRLVVDHHDLISGDQLAFRGAACRQRERAQ